MLIFRGLGKGADSPTSLDKEKKPSPKKYKLSKY